MKGWHVITLLVQQLRGGLENRTEVAKAVERRFSLRFLSTPTRVPPRLEAPAVEVKTHHGFALMDPIGRRHDVNTYRIQEWWVYRKAAATIA